MWDFILAAIAPSCYANLPINVTAVMGFEIGKGNQIARRRVITGWRVPEIQGDLNRQGLACNAWEMLRWFFSDPTDGMSFNRLRPFLTAQSIQLADYGRPGNAAPKPARDVASG